MYRITKGDIEITKNVLKEISKKCDEQDYCDIHNIIEFLEKLKERI